MAKQKGSGCLVKRGKMWTARWVVDGKVYVRTTGCTVKSEAEKKLKEFTHPFQVKSDIQKIENLEAKIRNEENKLAEADDEFATCPIQDVMKKFFSLANAPSVVDSTRTNYDIFLTLFTNYCKEHKLNVKQVKDVDVKIVEKFLIYYKEKVSAGRYNSLLAQFKRVWNEFSKLSKNRCFKENPWSNFKYRSADPSYKRELTVEELVKVLSLAKDENINLLFCIGLYTGLRLSDCCSLRWSEIDFIKNTITKIPMKTRRLNKAVVVPMHPVLRDKLLHHKEILNKKNAEGTAYDEDNEYVSYALVKQYNENTIGGKISNIFKKAKIQTTINVDGKKHTVCSFHSLRHTFVSMAASAGIPLDVVKNLVGHTSTKMTQHYEHISVVAAANAIKQLPAIGCANVEVQNKVSFEIDKSLVDRIKKITSDDVDIPKLLEEYVKSKEQAKAEPEAMFDVMSL